MAWVDRPVRIRVPATSANLGPGFDSLGLALGLHDVVRARIGAAGLAIRVTGEGEQSSRYGEGHLVIRAMREGFAAIGGQPPGIELNCRNVIPHGFGLGSSAAAIVAGLLIARQLCGPAGFELLSDHLVLQIAAEMDGHADNVAACLGGGLTVAWRSSDGFRFARLPVIGGLAPVACIPKVPLATTAARKVLPASVPHAEAAQNAARAALLIAALTTDPSPLFDATADYLHQPYRAAAMPESATLMTALRDAGIPAVISGAGPSVLALTVPGLTPGPDQVAAIAAAAGPTWTVLELPVDRQGARPDPI